MLKPPKSMFQDAIVLKSVSFDPDDPYGEKTIEQETRINKVRFDLRTVYSGTNNDRQVVANATAIFMQSYTTPWYDFSEKDQGSKLVWNGHEYTITSINRDLEPFSNKVYQYKVQVI